VTASFVVIATGAQLPPGLGSRPGAHNGNRLFGYEFQSYCAGHVPGNQIWLCLSGECLEGTAPVASYVQVTPIGGERAQVQWGFPSFRGEDETKYLRRLFPKLMRRFSRWGESLRGLRWEGRWQEKEQRQGPLPFLEDCPGVLLVGEAAGLTNPLTGSRLALGLLSGKLAADVLHGALPAVDPQVELTAYSQLLTARVGDLCRMGHGSPITRHWFAQLVQESCELDRPWLVATRHALLFESTKASPQTEALPEADPAPTPELPVGSEFAAVRDFLEQLHAPHFPLLATLIRKMWDEEGCRVRTALLCGAWPAERSAGEARESVAIALELAHLALQLFNDVVLAPTNDLVESVPRHSPCSWSNRFVLMLGDFFLVRSYALLATKESRLAALAAASLCRSCSGAALAEHEGGELSWPLERYMEYVRLTHATFYQLPCEIGAVSREAPAPLRTALTTFGCQLGTAWHLVREIRLVQREIGEVTEHPLWYALLTRLYPLPVRLAAATAAGPRLRAVLSREQLDEDELREVQQLVAAQDALATVGRMAWQHLQQAQSALEQLPADNARDQLGQVASWVQAQLTGASAPPGPRTPPPPWNRRMEQGCEPPAGKSRWHEQPPSLAHQGG
jgi:octaprenyl-diphosphate synthase